ncbi:MULTISPECIES: hypothetical protein [Eubacterium]|uniref:hypothetical protein n=1 Tax=Eubacterium TaxID=1730 RepID=UPI000E478079|nr:MULTISPECIES: hypothetical protein [Eubacterium]MBS5620673.1 hypothetical protein [Eubacterium sp.]RGF49038.1 hypothetical protein DW006_10120 [Eubacterium sp. AF36-5BH]
MEKYKYLVIFIALVTFGLVGCGNTNTSDKGTEATTSRQEVESYAKNQTSVLCDYYKDESGVWHAEGKQYTYRLILTGKSKNAAKKSKFVVLSNDKNITFQDVADSMLSNNSEDRFDENKTIIVEME